MLRKKSPNPSFVSHFAALLTLVFLAGCANSSRVTAVSENFNSRVSIIVIHHTTANFEDSLRILTKRSGRPVSSHYLVPEPDDPSYTEKKLRIYQLVPETGRAWHAGNSYWGGRISLNDQSIGIEIVNQTYCKAGSELAVDVVDEGLDAEDLSRICFYPDFPESQMALVIELLEDILERYPDISPTNIVGHSDIAPDRKIDPGPRFPWQRLYRLGFGAWFDDDTVVRYWEQFRRAPMPLSNVQRALAAYGYELEPSGVLDEHTRNVLRAFQMHFRPSHVTGTPGLETTAILYALIEKYHPDALEDLLHVAPASPETDIDNAIAVDDEI